MCTCRGWILDNCHCLTGEKKRGRQSLKSFVSSATSKWPPTHTVPFSQHEQQCKATETGWSQSTNKWDQFLIYEVDKNKPKPSWNFSPNEELYRTGLVLSCGRGQKQTAPALAPASSRAVLTAATFVNGAIQSLLQSKCTSLNHPTFNMPLLTLWLSKYIFSVAKHKQRDSHFHLLFDYHLCFKICSEYSTAPSWMTCYRTGASATTD